MLSALRNVDWHRLFANQFVFTNFVPNYVITCDDREPPWINDNIKTKIRRKNSMYKNYKRNGKNTEDYKLLTKAVSEVSQLRRVRMSTITNWAND